MATVTWTAYANIATSINGDATAPTAKALANAAQKCGNEIDNTSALALYADFDLYWRGASAPAAGAYVALYLVPAVDGTNYADGADDTVTPPDTAWVGSFPLRAVTTQQRVALRGVLLSPGKQKVVIINKSGQAATNTDNENILKYRTYSETVA
jgi:hypothetical protein